MSTPVALFDVDDTLTDRQAAFHTWARDFAAEHGLPLDDLTEADARLAGNRHAFFAELIARHRIPGTPAELTADFRKTTAGLVPYRPEARDALTKLREHGWRIGVVTNGEPEAQAAKIDHARLTDLIDTLTVSGAHGIRKPDPRLFHIALTQLGTRPGGHVWMTGDQLDTDIAGATAAGLKSVWLTPHRPEHPTSPHPTRHASDLTRAVMILLETM